MHNLSEIVMYTRAKTSIIIAVCTLGLIILPFLIHHLKENFDDFLAFLLFFVWIFLWMIIIYNFHPFLASWFAPSLLAH